MNRNTLTIIVGALVVAVAVIGYLLYREQHKPGLEINVNDKGMSVQTN